jgi:methionyl-tRNA synthetase
MTIDTFFTTPLGYGVFLFLVLWSVVWKGIALWKCGRNNQLAWFVAILILNTLGILPIIYLTFFQKKHAKKR